MIKNYLGKFAIVAILMASLGGSASALTLSGAVNSSSSLVAEDFGIMNQSGVKGYTAGFRLAGDADFDDVESITVKLYSGNKLLQTNTATEKIEDLNGSQFSTPFDVFGNFNYEADGYWENDREREYGKNLMATKVVARVELEDGTVLRAANLNLTGDTEILFPDRDDDNKPDSKKECKKHGWKGFLSKFRNQGQCIKFHNHLSLWFNKH